MGQRLRQDAIVRSLRRNGTSTVGGLAEDVGASRRTVLRDISALHDEGFVIHSEPGRGGGVRLDPQSVQATPRLSVTEVFALLVSVAAVRAAGSLPFSELADSGLAKIEKSLPAENIRGLRQFLERVYVGRLSPQVDLSDLGVMEAALLPTFQAAFLQQLQLRFRYRDKSGKLSHRQVEPQAMLVLQPLWYLVAWDPARDGIRHFRMDRISKPSVVEGATFRRRRVQFEDGVRGVSPY